MCGVCGVVGRPEEDLLWRMTSVLGHRGPDGDGIRLFPADDLGLGHTRLAVIDPSPAGDQPMCAKGERVCLVYNGEVYNFAALRGELEEEGVRFRSRTDTEVILRLYLREGIGCVSRLNGMFAFALADRRNGKLYLVRDRVGIKPLYYCDVGSCLLFASEIKSILASGRYTPGMNRQALYDYFTFLYVPGPDTMFRGIREVPPAHVVEVDLATRERRARSYWRADRLAARMAEGGRVPSEEECGARLRELLEDAVQKRLVADVPLGVFLSGGIDSPVVTGLMAEACERPVKTFTVGFRGAGTHSFDETEAARKVSERFGTEHHEVVLDVTEPEGIFDLLRYFDQPFGNPTYYLQHLIAAHAREKVTVALCGAGGDELFAGYPRYRAERIARRLGAIPGPVLRALRAVARLPVGTHGTPGLRRAREFLEGMDADPAARFMAWTYFFGGGRKDRLLGPLQRTAGENGEELLPSDRILRARLDDSAVPERENRLLHLDVETFLVDNVLEYTDRMSMAVSLETRVPYLDHRLVEFALGVPFDYKLRRGRGKALLRREFADLLPAEIRKGRKQGFNPPLAAWLRNGLDAYFEDPAVRKGIRGEGLLSWEEVQRLREEHRRGRRDNSHELFAVMAFDAWFRRYMLGEESALALGVRAGST